MTSAQPIQPPQESAEREIETLRQIVARQERSIHLLEERQRQIADQLLIYIVGFAIGRGPVYWLMSSEIFPTRLRGAASGASTSVNWAANLLVTVTFLTLIGALGRAVTFWIYAAFSLVALIFVMKLVPETKNRPLEEIEEHWDNDRKWPDDARSHDWRSNEPRPDAGDRRARPQPAASKYAPPPNPITPIPSPLSQCAGLWCSSYVQRHSPGMSSHRKRHETDIPLGGPVISGNGPAARGPAPPA